MGARWMLIATVIDHVTKLQPPYQGFGFSAISRADCKSIHYRVGLQLKNCSVNTTGLKMLYVYSYCLAFHFHFSKWHAGSANNELNIAPWDDLSQRGQPNRHISLVIQKLRDRHVDCRRIFCSHYLLLRVPFIMRGCYVSSQPPLTFIFI